MSIVDTLILADDSTNWDLAAWAENPPELVVSLGDLSETEVGTVRAVTGAPVIGVYGNHCVPGYLGEGDVSFGEPAALSYVKATRVLGVSGCVRYKPEPGVLYTQEEYAAALGVLDGAELVITHCPPTGCNTGEDFAHQGIDALAEYVRRWRPKTILHGHTYPETPVTEFEGAEVVYVNGHIRRDLEF